jgi:hypothetical protein
MEIAAITRYITSTFPDIHPVPAWGEVSFFYNPGRALPRGVYFATLKDKDGDNDRASHLHRVDVFRFNIGISAPTYRALFVPPPPRAWRARRAERAACIHRGAVERQGSHSAPCAFCGAPGPPAG